MTPLIYRIHSLPSSLRTRHYAKSEGLTPISSATLYFLPGHSILSISTQQKIKECCDSEWVLSFISYYSENKKGHSAFTLRPIVLIFVKYIQDMKKLFHVRVFTNR